MLVKEMLYSFIRSLAICFFSNISNFRIKISGFLVLVPVLKYESLLIYVIFWLRTFRFSWVVRAHFQHGIVLMALYLISSLNGCIWT